MLKNITIQKGVTRAPTATLTKYPWHQMDVGDCIMFEKKNTANAHAKRAAERFAPKVFESGMDTDGNPGVWRTA